jgi:DNA-directed RNA polymerase subunit RPC12/RpoP
MRQGRDAIRWTRRVKKAKLRRLYERFAEGLVDGELIDDVGMTLYMRCRDILTVQRAKQGRQVRCPVCDRAGEERFIARHDGLEEQIRCPACGWEICWHDYTRAVQRKQLNAGGATEAFAGFMGRYDRARSHREKMLAIDQLIHEFHFSLRDLPDLPTRPAGVNLIEGRMTEVAQFLDDLTAGRLGDPAMQRTRREWEENLQTFREIDWDVIREERKG